MNSRIIRMLLVLTLVFTWLAIKSTPAQAASCFQTSCEDQNPSTMGCGTDAVTSGTRKYLSDGGSNLSFVETSKSAACDAKWARAYNRSGYYEYVAASLRYGCSNYCYSKSVSTRDPIASSGTVGVYTPMHAYVATPTRSCGVVSAIGPIAVPISISDTRCTGSN